MANQPVEVEIRETGQTSGKPRSSLNPGQIYAVGDQPQTDDRSWLHRNAFLLCFLFGWIFFPFWWGAAIWGIKNRQSLKGSEKAAWYGCMALSLAGIIIFLIFIIWYGADPLGARKALTSFYIWDESTPSSSTPSSSTDSSIALAQFTLKYRGSCNDTTYNALVSSVNATMMTGISAVDQNFLVAKGDPCTTKDTTSGRHLLELVSTYYVLVKVKTGATDDFKLELAAHIEQISTNGTNPAWCGTFCTVHASDIVETGAERIAYSKCSAAGTDSKAYTCQSGTLIGDNLALVGKITDAACCSTCNSVCPSPVAVRENVTLAANQEPTFELCCNPCYNLTCSLGAVSPPPTLDTSTPATDDICCNQAPVVAPTVSMQLSLPGCNQTDADALASHTQEQITAGQNGTAGILSVKGECVAADNTTTSSGRRLTDAEGVVMDSVRLIITVVGPKTSAEMQEATKVFVAAFGFDVADNATTEDLVAQLQTLQAPNTTTLGTIVTKIQKACADAGLPVVVSVDAIQQSLKTVTAVCLCPGLPSVANVVFPVSCSSSKIGDICPGSCKAPGIGMMTSTCGTNGTWAAATGSCTTSSTVSKMTCTQPPAAVPNAAWLTNCTGQDSCSAQCDTGFSGQPTATCNPLTGAWSAPIGDCSPVKCPPLTNDATTSWPLHCLLNKKDFVCQATCKKGAYGAAPAAQCTLQASGNSAVWNISSTFISAVGCYAPVTCDTFQSSGVVCNGTKSVLMLNQTCLDPQATFDSEGMPRCSADECCRIPKTCGAQAIRCNATTQRLFGAQVCEDNNQPACDADHCCVNNHKCKDSYITCPAHTVAMDEKPCGPDLEEGQLCSQKTCCNALPQYPVNATCGDLDGNMTARSFTDDDCGFARKYNVSAANVTVVDLIKPEAVPVCCQGIVVLALTRSTTPADLLIGSTFNLTVTVNNIGLQDAANVTVSQVLPQGMSLKGTAPAGCNTTGNVNTVVKVVCGPIHALAAQGDGVSYIIPLHVNTSGSFDATTEAAGTGAADGLDYEASAPTPLTVKQTCTFYQPNGTAFVCPSLYVNNPDAAAEDVTGADQTVTRDTCCYPTCSALSFECSKSSVALKTDAAVTACVGGECTDDLCCDPACESFSNNCSTGWSFKMQASGQVCPAGKCDDVTCCQKTCDSFLCGTNYTAKTSDIIICKDNECDTATCCALSCASYTCKDPSLLGLGIAGLVPCINNTCNDATCCVEPGTCASYSCANKVNYLPPIVNQISDLEAKSCNSTTCNPDLCCRKSCALYPCTGQYVNRTNANTIPCGGGGCASDCCEMLQPDLTIQQSIVPADGKILVGDTFTIKITVKNDGQWEALQATITTTPLSGLQYVGIPDDCTAAGGQLSCAAAKIAINASTDYTITAKATAPGVFTLSTSSDQSFSTQKPQESLVTVGQTCQHWGSNGDSWQFSCGDKFKFNDANANVSEGANKTTCCIEEFPDVTLSPVTASAEQVLIGDNVTFTVTVNNIGDYKASNATVTHTMSPTSGLNFTGSTADCEVNRADGIVICKISSIAATKNVKYEMVATAMENGPQTMTTTVAVDGEIDTENNLPVLSQITVYRTCQQFSADKSSFTCAADYAFNNSQANYTGPDLGNCCFELYPDLTIQEQTIPADGVIDIGDEVLIKITLSNQGNGSATNATLIQTLPEGLMYVDMPAGCVSVSPTKVNCTKDSIARGGEVSYDFTVKAMVEGQFNATSSVLLEADSNKTSNGPVVSEVTVQRTCSQYYNNKTPYVCPDMYGPNAAQSDFVLSPGAGDAIVTQQCCTELFPKMLISLAASGLDSSGALLIGEIAIISATITNVGQYKADSVQVTQILPDYLNYFGTAPLGCTYTRLQMMSCTVDRLAVEGIISLHAAVKAVKGSAPGGIVATVSASRAMQVPSNQIIVTVGQTCGQYTSDKGTYDCTGQYGKFNSDSFYNNKPDQTTCCLWPFLTLTQHLDAVDGLMHIGDSVLVTVNITNTGDYEADNAALTFAVPVNMQLVGYSPDVEKDCNLTTNTCTRATIGINERVSYTFIAKATAVGSYSFTSHVTAPGDRNTANILPQTLSVVVDQICGQFNPDKSQYNCTKLADNYVFDNSGLTTAVDSSTAQATCCTQVFPDLALALSTNPASGSNVLIGDNVTIIVSINNIGGYKAVNSSLNITVPAGLQFVAAANDNVLSDCNTTALTCTKASLGSGESVNYIFIYKATATGSYNISSTVFNAQDSNSANNQARSLVIVSQTCGAL